MTKLIKQKIQEEILKLPKLKQEAINSFDWFLVVENIGKNFGLTTEEIENLQIETSLILIGLVKIEDFSINIEEKVELTEKESQKIAIEIFDSVFEPIANKIDSKNIENNKTSLGFIEVPQKIEVTSSPDQKVYEITTKYKLPLDKTDEIREVTVKFINGQISSTKYEEAISLITEFPSSRILEMINDINENIIKPKRQKMMEGEGKVIKNYELGIKNENTTQPEKKSSIPLPPYKTNTNEKLDVIQKEVSVDKYKEQGIEIIPDEIKSPEENKISSGYILTQKKDNVNNNEQPIVTNENKAEIPRPANIITNKLFENTNSKTVVNDYSLPKITPITKTDEDIPIVAPEKPHDPYHEAI